MRLQLRFVSPLRRPSTPINLHETFPPRFVPNSFLWFSQIISDMMPADNPDGTPSIGTPRYDANATVSMATNTTNREVQPHSSGLAPAATTSGNPLITTPPSDPNTNWDVPVAHRLDQVPPANANGTPSTAPPHYDGNPSSNRYDSSSTSTTGSHPQLPGGPTERGQNVQSEGRKSNIAPASAYFGGIGRTIAGAILGSGGSVLPPRDRTKEELHRTRAKFQYQFRPAREDNATFHQPCCELDSENRRNKDTIQSLQDEITNMGLELQKYKNLSDMRGKQLVANQASLTKADKLLSERRSDLELTNNPQTTPTNNEETLSASRAILDGTGATPLMAIIDAMLVLHKEIAKVSNFLAENIRHTSYELFQEELGRCYQDSEEIIGGLLSKFLHDHSEAEELSQSLIKITIQIFITSFCAYEWDRYLDTPLHVGE